MMMMMMMEGSGTLKGASNTHAGHDNYLGLYMALWKRGWRRRAHHTSYNGNETGQKEKGHIKTENHEDGVQETTRR